MKITMLDYPTNSDWMEVKRRALVTVGKEPINPPDQRWKEKILIIDAKYYGQTMQKQFDKYSLHSGNVYQIFTYVKNQDKDNTGNVAGILLYAKTDEDITPDCMFNMGGNQIGVKTLDLNKDFPLIAAQLDKLAEDYFGIRTLCKEEVS